MLARFLDAVWRKDADSLATCFVQDGEWKLAGLHMRGRSEINRTFAALLAHRQVAGLDRRFSLRNIPRLE
jgi:hypothetical protein